ncbi:3-isopropylmalate dehydratase small subunit [Cupriavidus plantarum]|uniref:3-isopropylmalate dehydratase n=1 Tax=Cupriavidus plantarum TaxID=942865 RepID=A0A316EKQ3_9BURK|nr:3-isopropylmalate dehydratase small subunit [Cupriavidus plantarum]NYI02281.1 3-isopropylmalate/(R)-2-methylmalate dehydratase small subunit [Cupriavidus plantarum]PWK33062.1 3-isopropylmalate dehydratase small subunit [Cupriavidus plantarum]RLK31063.1 3-isopropylmalate dehydratase small subunit [Cupriavidus plantarum]
MKAVIAEVQGRAAVMQRDDIDTDAIFPGRFLRLVQRTGMGAHLFADWLAEGRPEVAFMADATPPRMVVALQNFGCGSSREHAVWALSDYGVKAVIALSFGDIFRNNCVKNGVVAAIVTPADHARLLQALGEHKDASLLLRVAERTLRLPDGATIPITLADGHAEQLLSAEDEVDRTLAHEAALRAYEARVQREQPWLASMG